MRLRTMVLGVPFLLVAACDSGGPSDERSVQSLGGPGAKIKAAGSAVEPAWPMQGHDANRTGLSPHLGPAQASLRWAYDLGARLQDNTSPIIDAEGTVYVTGMGGAASTGILAIRQDGTLKWSQTTKRDGNLSWEWGSNMKFAGALSSDGSSFYATAKFLDYGTGDYGWYLAAHDTSTGTALWTSRMGNEVTTNMSYSSFAVGNLGEVVFGTWAPTVVAVASGGTTLWQYGSGSGCGIEAAPAIDSNGNVYVAHNCLGLIAVDSNGQPLWQNSANAGGYGWPTPTIGPDGTVYLAGDAGTTSTVAINPNGSYKWQATGLASGGYFAGLALSADGQTLFTGRSEGHFYALDTATGAVVWHVQLVDEQPSFSGSPALSSNGILYAMGENGYIYAILAADGTLLWKYQLNTGCMYWGCQSPAIGPDGTLYVLSSGDLGFSGGTRPAVLYGFQIPVAITVPTVTASDGSHADRVRVSWTASSGATSYQVYRNTSDSLIGATRIGTPTASPYDDTIAVPGVTYYYFVKACTSEGCGDFSTSDSGYPQASAIYDAALKAPKCSAVGTFCDSGALLVGRGTLGPEPNAPNTIAGACADGTSGTFHGNESLDRLRISSLDGTNLAPGRSARIEATVWAKSTSADYLDLYLTTDATAATPVWTLLTGVSLKPSATGLVVLSLDVTLPAPGGTEWAIRGIFRYSGIQSSCSSGIYDDQDDLVFVVGAYEPNAAYDTTLKAPKCDTPSPFCDSGTLLLGRATLGPESNAPNTIASTCADGTSGTFHVDESLDRLRISSLDGTNLAPGKSARIDAQLWAYSTASDYLDLYLTTDATATPPVWTLLTGTSLKPAVTGQVVISQDVTLPATGGTEWAIRGSLRYAGSQGLCPAGNYNDRDDLVFVVGASPALTLAVTSPNGAESWVSGSTQSLTWEISSPVSTGAFNMWLIDGDGNWLDTGGATVLAEAGKTQYSASWYVNVPVRSGYKLTVYYRPDANVWGGWTANDISDNNFAVTSSSALTLAVTSPNGSESWTSGSTQTLTWEISTPVSEGAFNLWLVDGSGNWLNTVGTVLAEAGKMQYSASWQVNVPARSDYKLTVYYRPDAGVWGGWTANDISDSDFAVTSSLTLTVTSPNGSENWVSGSTHDLTWDISSPISTGAFNLWLIDGNGNWLSTVGTVLAEAGKTQYSASWSVNAPTRSDYKLTVYYRPDANVWGGWTANDISNNNFAVTSSSSLTLTVTSPNGAESWASGSTQNLTWEISSPVSEGAFSLWLIDGDGNWLNTVGTVLAEAGRTQYGASWQVNAPVRGDYKLTVYYRPDANVWGGWTANDLSDNDFVVTTP